MAPIGGTSFTLPHHRRLPEALLDVCLVGGSAWKVPPRPDPGGSSTPLDLGATKPYKFIGFGAIGATKPYIFIGFGAIGATRPYIFIGFGAIDATTPYEFVGFGAMDATI